MGRQIDRQREQDEEQNIRRTYKHVDRLSDCDCNSAWIPFACEQIGMHIDRRFIIHTYNNITYELI